MPNNKTTILVSGSLVYDRIMDFPGYFKDHIMPDKIHILNVSFVVNNTRESFGGTAGNIAYNLSLLGERPTILSAVGNDFGVYKKWLLKNKIDCSQIKIVKDKNTASCYITTDMSDNQITAFNPGALVVENFLIPQTPQPPNPPLQGGHLKFPPFKRGARGVITVLPSSLLAILRIWKITLGFIKKPRLNIFLTRAR